MIILRTSDVDELLLNATINGKSLNISETYNYLTGAKTPDRTAEESLVEKTREAFPDSNAIVVTVRVSDSKVTGKPIRIEGLPETTPEVV